MNSLDYVVLLGTILGIAAYGMWRTRGRRDLNTYLKGDGTTGWIVIGLSVMATQASAITFLSTPGQGYQSGLGFVQNYFGMPLALILIAVVFLPIYRRLKVHTVYEFLGQRFDAKTRLLGAGLFLLQRGLAAGITIYAPAIVLSTVLGWRLDLTIICSGLVVTAYTVAGGSDAVSHTQKFQMTVIFVGMLAALVVLVVKLPAGLTLDDTFALAGGLHKLEAVNFSTDPKERYTFWTGMIGASFLMLSYFGTDQSQVQRYISGASLRESRLGLMFNAVCKIPMQFMILMLGVLMFIFYQFVPPPVFFNEVAWKHQVDNGSGEQLQALEADFVQTHDVKRQQIEAWLQARHDGDTSAAANAHAAVLKSHQHSEAIRENAKKALGKGDPLAKTNDADYVFITFILHHLPHGVIGLLVAAFFAAALSSKAAELNALGSTTIVDFYQHLLKRQASDRHYVVASKCFIMLWGLVAIAFALFANMTENLVQAANIVGSVFYGVVLGLFLVAFFVRWVGGTAVFWGALAAQVLVIVLYIGPSKIAGQMLVIVLDNFDLPATVADVLEILLHDVLPMIEVEISYLWYNLIGCAACVLFSVVLQGLVRPSVKRAEI